MLLIKTLNTTSRRATVDIDCVPMEVKKNVLE